MLLTATGISKSFPGVRALQDVPFDLQEGEIHALVGENGAGKSTLIKILTGALQPDRGTIRLNGARVAPTSPLDAQRRGISAVYQEIDLIPDLSLAENIWLGREPRTLGIINRRAAHARARDAMARIGVDADLARPAGRCAIALQQMTAIARAVDMDAKVLVLDEPTSSLDAAETNRLFDLVRTLAARGLGVVFITHFLDQVFDLATRVTVLRNGRHVATLATPSVTRLRLIADMLGRDEAGARAVHERTARPAPADAPIALRALGVARGTRIGPVDLEIRRGEILGLAGLLGSGRTETARLLAGADHARDGTISIGSFTGRWRSPRHAIDHRIGFAPEDRRADAVFPSLSLEDNVVIAAQARRGLLTRIPRRRRRDTVRRFVDALAIATRDASTPAGTLSGGNQQKAVLARWLASDPLVLILDEPTRGVDIGARADIERLIDECCQEGLGVLLISSEFEEIERLAHRVVVMRDGRSVAALADVSIEAIMKAIAGSAHARA